MADKGRFDEATGTHTTGHVWDDDLEELNKPLPKWWLYVLYACIIWAIVYWVLYPSWPMMTDYTKGTLGFSQRALVMEQVAAGKAAQAKFRDAIAKAEISEIPKKPELLNFALAGGKAAFGDNCAPCHGRGAQGFKGYPNLNDDDWIWGGDLEAIQTTIRHGIRSNADDDTRASDMPKFGEEDLLEKAQIKDVAEYVLSLGGSSKDADAAARGKEVYAENCASCHGENGEGNQELGAPNLADAIWLYGGDKADIVTSINTGRGGVMPPWSPRLDDVTIKQLTVYVHSLGGGK
ncbi:MAG: cytochrome-c oxidase, cbb3-type subunit III [Alphaproteobacteria bacterium]|nr:cytochrome-c oxidase, cbb3-type subunit III [Alphaproteobacteria bacterium]